MTTKPSLNWSGQAELLAAVLAVVLVSLAGCGKKANPKVPQPVLPAPVAEIDAEVGCSSAEISFTPPLLLENGTPIEEYRHFLLMRKITPPRDAGRSATATEDTVAAMELQQVATEDTVALMDAAPLEVPRLATPDTIIAQEADDAEPADVPEGWAVADVAGVAEPKRKSRELPVISTDWEPVAFIEPPQRLVDSPGVPVTVRYQDTGRRFRLARGEELTEIPLPQDADGIPLVDSWFLPGYRYDYMVYTVDGRRRMASDSEVTRFRYYVPPSPPRELTAKSLEDGLLLRWVPVETTCTGEYVDFRVSYEVYRVAGRVDNEERPRGVSLGTSTQPLFKDRDIEDNRRYTYYVRAVNEDSDAVSVNSELLSATWIDTFPPEPPQSLSFAVSGRAVTLYWEAASEDDVAGTIIEVSVDDGPWEQLGGGMIRTNTFRHDALFPQTTYRYRMFFVDASFQENQSEASEILTVTLP